MGEGQREKGGGGFRVEVHEGRYRDSKREIEGERERKGEKKEGKRIHFHKPEEGKSGV